MTTKPGLLLMMTDIDPANEADFNRWYEEEHLDERRVVYTVDRHVGGLYVLEMDF